MVAWAGGCPFGTSSSLGTAALWIGLIPRAVFEVAVGEKASNETIFSPIAVTRPTNANHPAPAAVEMTLSWLPLPRL